MLRQQVDELRHTGMEMVGMQTRMQSLLHQASDAIIQFDSEGYIESFNRAAEKVFDVPEISVLHQSIEHLFQLPEEYAGRLLYYLSQYARDTEDQYETPLTGLRPDGSKRLLTVSVAEISSDDLVMFDDNTEDTSTDDFQYQAMLCIFHDITERKQIDAELNRHREELQALVDEQVAEVEESRQQAEEASRAKSAFLASMSHELRTPMHAILSYADFGIRKVSAAEPEKLRQYFDRIRSSAERLMVMINDLLDLSKVEAGRMSYDMREHDLVQVANRVVNDFESLLIKHEVELRLNSELEDATVVCDDERICQVLANFVSNAIKFSPAHSTLEVCLQAAELSQDGQKYPAVKISVRDQGIGVPIEEIECIFEKFRQSSRNKKEHGGTGLGLAIAREITHAHGGEVGANNRDTGGAEFFCVLPRQSLYKESSA